MRTWHIITCEYPPQVGGVSDYTGLLAEHLVEAGDTVHVWAPAIPNSDTVSNLHRTLGHFDKSDFVRTQSEMQRIQPSPRDVLVQYVPHGFGHRSMNLAFCRWIESLSKSGNRIHLMVHEPYLESGQGSWKQRIVSQVHRWMIRILLRSASRVFISIPAWERYLRPYASANAKFEWLPIPATVPVTANPEIAKSPLTVGHLGTYSVEMTSLLCPGCGELLRLLPSCELLLLGRGSEVFAARLKNAFPDVASRVSAAGVLTNDELSKCIGQCSLMLQPFPDGLSSRRTSLMNCLSHGIAVVSNQGHLTENFWASSGAVRLSSTDAFAQNCAQLLNDPEERSRVANRGRELYNATFDWPRILHTLRSSA